MSVEGVVVKPVVRGAAFCMAHVPGMVLSGSKPRREITHNTNGLKQQIVSNLRSFADAVAYPPHQVMIGNLTPEALSKIERPWHQHPIPNAAAEGPGGRFIDEATFYAWMARGDCARLLRFNEFLPGALETALAANANGAKIQKIDKTALADAIANGAEPFFMGSSDPVGVFLPAHEEDESLMAPVLMENAAAKVTGAIALTDLLKKYNDPPVDHLLGCGEEAVGDRYQRGGGNLAKAMGEMVQGNIAGGTDVKSFCAGGIHAMLLGAALIASGMHRRVVVVAGGSLPKLGMKFQGHLQAGYPILEDVVVGVAIDLAADDHVSPIIRLDCSAFHRLGQGSAAHQMAGALSAGPLYAQNLRLSDVDRYAVELHNPDITEPAGSGNVPLNNYQILAAIAAQKGEIQREQMPEFVAAHGIQGFSPTQGHIASAVPYLPHAIAGLTSGNMNRVQFVAKASLFLGRMTGASDGASLLIERNPALTQTQKGV
ncbi:MAG TPA: glycine/sarcosine/betaine reductase complex component C subunit beta [Desulfosalsimonadaceae bacterium]|nr:glycine/sarcosine/betaine reductase complex component C subunit beta [Desulfosalsimonadaceae bacterium]